MQRKASSPTLHGFKQTKFGGLGDLKYPLVYDVVKYHQGITLRGLFIIDKESAIQHSTVNNLAIDRSVDWFLINWCIFKLQEGRGLVALTGEVLEGNSIRKVIVREAKNHTVSVVLVGIIAKHIGLSNFLGQSLAFHGSVIFLANLSLSTLNIEVNHFSGVIPVHFHTIPNLNAVQLESVWFANT